MKDAHIGLFGGSFDPVHTGHLLLAADAREHLGLDRLVFLPAKISPHKLDSPPSPPESRRALLEAAIAGEPSFHLDARELDREGPSFTIDTVREYRREFPRATLHYLIGDDNLPDLDTWRDIADLRANVRFVVLARHGIPDGCPYPVIARRIEISSTEIRKRVAEGRSVRYMVPVAVGEMIERLGLYRND
jgi:nicotinate-nucleotide adenylyltransferase